MCKNNNNNFALSTLIFLLAQTQNKKNMKRLFATSSVFYKQSAAGLAKRNVYAARSFNSSALRFDEEQQEGMSLYFIK